MPSTCELSLLDFCLSSSFCSAWTECSTFASFISDDEDPKKFPSTAPITDAPVVEEPPSQEAAVVPKSPEAAAKKVGPRAYKHLKKASTTSTSFDASQLVIPTDDVSTVCFYCFTVLNRSPHTLPWTGSSKKVLFLG
jgi:hypothetical protein